VYPVWGCTDPGASNYNPSATNDDGSCTYPPATVYGCTDPSALNYNPSANAYDGRCVYPIRGCTDPSAVNYDPNANQNDGSCVYCASDYRQVCTGSPSAPNGCGQTSPGGAGTYHCEGSGSDGVGPTPADAPGYGNSCGGGTTAPNLCGQDKPGSHGSIQCDGGCSGYDGSTPSNDSCPAVTTAISADPNPLVWNNSGTTLSWSSANASSCTASGEWAGAQPTSGTAATAGLSVGSHTYGITCSAPWESSPSSVTVTVTPPVPAASSVTYSPPNYCTSGPGGFVAWSYSDPSGSPQTAYEVLIAGYDSGKIISTSHVFAILNGTVTFGNTYNARVRVWNTYDSPSGYSAASANWSTPPYAYPDMISPDQFTWPTPPKPQEDVPVNFSDHTVFGGGSASGRSWNWTFGDGATSTQQNPTHTYNATGDYTVSETVADAAGQTCSLSQSLNVLKPIPIIKDVTPR